ncbi:MAG: thioredoxin TrxC [Burkholderiaceae bacterium]|nr:thioredoxin TrxC [Burkholderiaceae bacterium]
MDDRIQVVCPACKRPNRLPPGRVAESPDCGACGKPLFDGRPVELTDENFERFVERTDLPVVVDFWAVWCGPCRMMAPQFEQVARQMAGRAQFVKVDTDANPELARRFAIRSIPTIALLDKGREKKRAAGAMMAPQLAQWIAS